MLIIILFTKSVCFQVWNIWNKFFYSLLTSYLGRGRLSRTLIDCYNTVHKSCTLYTLYINPVHCIHCTYILYTVYTVHKSCTLYTLYIHPVHCVHCTNILYTLYTVHTSCTLCTLYICTSCTLCTYIPIEIVTHVRKCGTSHFSISFINSFAFSLNTVQFMEELLHILKFMNHGQHVYIYI